MAQIFARTESISCVEGLNRKESKWTREFCDLQTYFRLEAKSNMLSIYPM